MLWSCDTAVTCNVALLLAVCLTANIQSPTVNCHCISLQSADRSAAFNDIVHGLMQSNGIGSDYLRLHMAIWASTVYAL